MTRETVVAQPGLRTRERPSPGVAAQVSARNAGKAALSGDSVVAEARLRPAGDLSSTGVVQRSSSTPEILSLPG